jgi:integrase
MVIVGLRTGLRIGELIALRWEDVDLVAARLVVRRSLSGKKSDTPKNHRAREVPLSEAALRALKAHRHAHLKSRCAADAVRLLDLPVYGNLTATRAAEG